MKTDIPDKCDDFLKEIMMKSGMKLTNKKHLIAVALLRLSNESKNTKKEQFLTDMVVDIYELQRKGILGKKIRKMPKEDEEK